MNNRKTLFLASLTSLFLELMLIRWVSTEIPMLSYLKNFPLLAAFTGLGIGCLLAGYRRSFWTASLWTLFVLLLVVCLTDKLGLDRMAFPEDKISFWENSYLSTQSSALWIIARNLSIIFLILGGVCFSFIGSGQAIGSLLKTGTPLRMYTIDILGSLAGVLLFGLLSLLQTPCYVWVAIFVIPAWILGRQFGARIPNLTAATLLLAAIAVLSFMRIERSTQAGEVIRWSPYYMIQVRPPVDHPEGKFYELFVNRYVHQVMVDLSKSKNPKAYTDPEFIKVSAQYNFPFYIQPAAKSVLIAGAGTGNDVAAALRNGSGRVTAVEIDPGIVQLGRELHPEQPYASDRVRIVNDDIRSYLRRNDDKFDLAIYSILDSHTALSSLSSIRLDNYVYTVEGLRDVISHLNPDGVACLSFFVGTREWLARRLYHTIQIANGGVAPLATSSGEVSCFAFGPGITKHRAEIEQRLKALSFPIDNNALEARIKPATDDWPFLYSNPRGQPRVYYMSLVLIVLFSAILVWAAVRMGSPVPAERAGLDWHMFFLGAGFLLVETKALAELSLLFGSTWIVNTFVFAGVFVMVLCANFAVARGFCRRAWVSYGLLFASLLAWYFFPRAVLNDFGYGARAAIGTTLTVLPLFFAGQIFASSFATRKSANLAFGANLLGAVIGGAFEAASLVWGIRSLTLFAIGFYALSLLAIGLGRNQGRSPGAPAIRVDEPMVKASL